MLIESQILHYSNLIVAFGPSCLFVGLYILTRPQLFVVSIASAAIYLLSFAAAAIVRLTVFPLQSNFLFLSIITVVSQEAFRLQYLKYYFLSRRRFSVIAVNAVLYPIHDLPSAVAAGLSWGIANAIMIYGDVMVRATGAATIVSPRCPSMSTPVVSAWASFFTIIQHVAMMVIAYDAYRRWETHQQQQDEAIRNSDGEGRVSVLPSMRRSALLAYGKVAALNLSSVILGGLNLFHGGCVVYLIVEAFLTLFAVAMAFQTTHTRGYHSRRKKIHCE
mmetsp:Transcript_35144/g.56498  ORF Transcript_35144/g.56498 Transcript_35144/m.56498 type:complete len:276 (+) Transcript_35144:113-940(+)